MAAERIVSFLPSGTELLYEFGVQDRIYGVTHECRYPAGAASKPRVIDSAIDAEALSSRQIDEATCRLLSGGEELFVLDEDVLRDADPDLIISQGTCEACAAHGSHVDRAVRILGGDGSNSNSGCSDGGNGRQSGKRPAVHTMDPHNMAGIIDSVVRMGEILDMPHRAAEIVESLRERISRVMQAGRPQGSAPRAAPRVLAIEWVDPPFSAGHWIPEMIQMAGGTSAIGRTGERSRRISMQEMAGSDPDIIVLMPCGFDVARTVSEYAETLAGDGPWNSLKAVRDGSVFAVDANSFFSKPSIRTVGGLEILAGILRPDEFGDTDVAKESWVQITGNGAQHGQ